MSSELDRQIVDRKKEAAEKQIYLKAQNILDNLGIDTFEGDKECLMAQRGFLNTELKIIREERDLNSNRPSDIPEDITVVTIFYQGKPVFRQVENSITSFIPGGWEKILETLDVVANTQKREKQEAADHAKRQAELKEKFEQENATRARWGL